MTPERPVARVPTVVDKSSPEADLLLWSARIDGGARQVSVPLQERLDWSRLLRMAGDHGMLPLLYWRLHATCPDAVPALWMGRLRNHFEDSARQSMCLTGELCTILDILASRGITAIPFKGPVLAAMLYGNLALRRVRDLDILVHKTDLPKAKQLLVERGYRPHLCRTGAQEQAYLESGYDYWLARDEGNEVVELHWAVAEKQFCFPLDYERLWDRLEPVSVGGRELLTLSAEDLLLVLCVHGARHLWRNLNWICDVAALVDAPRRLDWTRVLGEASALGCERIVRLGLYLATDLLGATIPAEVSEKVRADASVQALARRVQERLFTETETRPGPFQMYGFYLSARERFRDRLKCCIRLALIPNEKDWALLPLPPSLWFLYSALRPIRLVGSYGLSVLTRSKPEQVNGRSLT